MKPKPLLTLKDRTIPVGISVLLTRSRRRAGARAASNFRERRPGTRPGRENAEPKPKAIRHSIMDLSPETCASTSRALGSRRKIPEHETATARTMVGATPASAPWPRSNPALLLVRAETRVGKGLTCRGTTMLLFNLTALSDAQIRKMIWDR